MRVPLIIGVVSTPVLGVGRKSRKTGVRETPGFGVYLIPEKGVFQTPKSGIQRIQISRIYSTPVFGVGFSFPNPCFWD